MQNPSEADMRDAAAQPLIDMTPAFVLGQIDKIRWHDLRNFRLQTSPSKGSDTRILFRHCSSANCKLIEWPPM